MAGIVEEHGRLDVVVNNAGLLRDAMITNMTEADFDLVVAVHEAPSPRARLWVLESGRHAEPPLRRDGQRHLRSAPG